MRIFPENKQNSEFITLAALILLGSQLALADKQSQCMDGCGSFIFLNISPLVIIVPLTICLGICAVGGGITGILCKSSRAKKSS